MQKNNDKEVIKYEKKYNVSRFRAALKKNIH